MSWRLAGHQDLVSTIVLSSDGQTLASTSTREAIIWNLPTKQYQRILLQDTAVKIHGLAFARDASSLVGFTFDGSLYHWISLSDNIPPRILQISDDGLRGLAVAPKGDVLALALPDYRIR